MKMKTLMAAFAIAVAGAAFPADTNYTAYAQSGHGVWTVLSHIKEDKTLKKASDYAAVFAEVDAVWSLKPEALTVGDIWAAFPKTAAGILECTSSLSDPVKAAILASCGPEKGLSRVTLDGHPQKINYLLQRMAVGEVNGPDTKRLILKEAVRLARYTIRAKGESFVGKEGLARMKGYLDVIAKGLNAPRFAGLKDALAAIGVSIEEDFILSLLPDEGEVSSLTASIVNGDEPFTERHRCVLTACLGVDDFNKFVRFYNTGK